MHDDYVASAVNGRRWSPNGCASSVDVGADSEGRFAALEAPPSTAAEAFRLLSDPRLLMRDTVRQVAMSAREGTVTVRVPGGKPTHVTL